MIKIWKKEFIFQIIDNFNNKKKRISYNICKYYNKSN